MIKTNELRIGNFVFIDGGVSIVSSIDEHCINQEVDSGGQIMNSHSESVLYIHLTEEWLLRSGARQKDKGFIYQIDEILFLIVEPSIYNEGAYEPSLMQVDGETSVSVILLNKDLFYVHQFQNLVFTLSGKELEFKDI
jgi:hypothetical protein